MEGGDFLAAVQASVGASIDDVVAAAGIGGDHDQASTELTSCLKSASWSSTRPAFTPGLPPRFVQAATRFTSRIVVRQDGREADAKSLISLLSLTIRPAPSPYPRGRWPRCRRRARRASPRSSLRTSARP